MHRLYIDKPNEEIKWYKAMLNGDAVNSTAKQFADIVCVCWVCIRVKTHSVKVYYKELTKVDFFPNRRS